jgi:hypothetical protein
MMPKKGMGYRERESGLEEGVMIQSNGLVWFGLVD